MHFCFPVIVCFLFESHCWSCVVIASYLSVTVWRNVFVSVSVSLCKGLFLALRDVNLVQGIFLAWEGMSSIINGTVNRYFDVC